ncbi:hypothetical protein K438DRAFT_1714453 [Mycena galopus ATCC 62051]|nr:hypothetical protein K438DRAFT_1714453 [Mycena galopus ATCC 62051]
MSHVADPFIIDLSQAPLEDVYKHLSCDAHGLTTEEAARRLVELEHKLEHTPKKQQHVTMQFLSFLCNPICWMLEASAIGLLILSSGAHQPPNWPTFLGIIILLCLNSALGVFVEHRAFRATSSLKELATNLVVMVKAKRDGVWSDIDSARLVPGDTIFLRTGDISPADCRVTSGDLYISDFEPENRRRMGDPCFLGSNVALGSGQAIVFAQGQAVADHRAHDSPQLSVTGLHGIVAQLGFFCLTAITVFLVAEILVLYARFHYSYHRGVDAVFVLIIASIPVALPTAVSVALSVGVEEFATHGVLTTRAAAVEELARVTVLCVEMTVLTEEELAVGDVRVYGPFTTADALLMAAYAQSTAPSGRPTSPSLPGLEYMGGGPLGHPDIEIAHWRPLSFVDGPIQVTYRNRGSAQLKRIAKGMIGHIANSLTRNNTNALEDQLEADVEGFALRGMGTVALAYEELDGDDPEADGNGLELVGILAFRQPLRENTAQAVAQLSAMGVQMKMVTSDQLAIAKETGRQAGLGDVMYPGKVFKDNGYQGKTLDELILEANGFAGVRPHHTRQLLQNLQTMDHFCAMMSKDASVANVNITVNRPGGDFVTAQPSLPAVVDAIRCSQQIFWRLRGCFIYACAICIRTLLCFSLLQFIYKIDFSPFMVFLVALATNTATLALSVDRAVSSTKPKQWIFAEIISYSAAYGVYLTLSTILFVQLTTETLFFEREFGVSLGNSQPQHDYQINMLIYLQVTQISQVFILIIRSRRLFFLHRPSAVLLGVFCLAQMSSSIIAAYGNWEFAGVNAIDAKWIGVVWVWNIVWFIPLELLKFGVDSALAACNLKS